MTYTQAQIDKANAVDLEKFLRAQGETLVRSGKEYRWKAHDSLTVCGNKWFRHSQSKGGLPVDFVMEFYGKPFHEAVQMLTGEPGEAQQDAEGLQTMRTLARNMTFLMKSIALGKEAYGLPEQEPRQGTNFIR